MTETTELAPFETTNTDGLMQDIERMKAGDTNIVSTFTGGDRGSKIEILKAMTNATGLDEVINDNQEIELANWVIQPIEMVDENTGELRQVPRIILVTTDGTAYHATSMGVFSALKNLSGILGMPSEDNDMWPVTVKPKREKTNNGFQVFTLVITG